MKKKDIEKGNRSMFIIKQKNNLLSKMCEESNKNTKKIIEEYEHLKLKNTI